MNELPPSPYVEIEGVPYLPRMCEKIRLMAAGTLREDLRGNLGSGMDLWTCQFFGVSYDDLRAEVLEGKDDLEVLQWARENGVRRAEFEFEWWKAYMRTRGFRDDLSERLEMRKKESPQADRPDVLTFMDYIDADEGRV